MSMWIDVGGSVARALEQELEREMPLGHVLKDENVQAIARRGDRDDVAFQLDDGRLCVVHLTYRAERDPTWPITRFVKRLPEDDDIPESDES